MWLALAVWVFGALCFLAGAWWASRPREPGVEDPGASGAEADDESRASLERTPAAAYPGFNVQDQRGCSARDAVATRSRGWNSPKPEPVRVREG